MGFERSNLLNKYKGIFSIIIVIVISVGANIGIDKWREYKYKPLFEKYLSERYTEKMVVYAIYKGSKWGEYEGSTYLKNNPKVKFYTFLRKDKTTNAYKFSDSYLSVLWRGEVQSEIEKYIKNVYKNIHSVDFQIMGKFQYDIDINQTQYDFNFNDYVPKSKIPAYDEVKDNPQIKEYDKTIEIYIYGDVNSSNEETEYENMFKVVQFVKEKGYNPNSLGIGYGQGTKSEKSSSFTCESRNIFIFDEREISRINSVNDLKSLIKK